MSAEHVLDLFDSFWFHSAIFSDKPASPPPQHMSAEPVLELFDSFWFHSAIFSDKPASPPPPPPPSSSSATRSSHEDHGNDEDDRLLLVMKLSRAPTLHVRSRSDQFSGGLGLRSDPFSPNSVLLASTSKLQTILSGEEVLDFEGELSTTNSEGETEESPSRNMGNKKSENMRRKKKERSKSSKSLSELEFEELKGFMDLGFVLRAGQGRLGPGLDPFWVAEAGIERRRRRNRSPREGGRC